MEKCKLLRFFILCNCVMLSVQIFGMDEWIKQKMAEAASNPNAMIVTGGVGNQARKINYITVGEKPKKIEPKKVSKPKDLPKWKSVMTEEGIVNKYLLGQVPFEKIIASSCMVRSCTEVDKQFPLLTLDVKNSNESEAYFQCVTNPDDKDLRYKFDLISSCLSIDNRDVYSKMLVISGPMNRGMKYKNFENFCRRAGIPPKIEIALFIPEGWDPHIHCKKATFKGNLLSKRLKIVLKDCGDESSLSGTSDEASISLQNSKLACKYLVGKRIRYDVKKKSCLSGVDGNTRGRMAVASGSVDSSSTINFGKNVDVR